MQPYFYVPLSPSHFPQPCESVTGLQIAPLHFSAAFPHYLYSLIFKCVRALCTDTADRLDSCIHQGGSEVCILSLAYSHLIFVT